MSQDADKKAAALAAADEVKEGMLVGLGTGSTAAFLIDELGRRFTAGLLWSRNQPLLGPRLVPFAQHFPWVFSTLVNHVAQA